MSERFRVQRRPAQHLLSDQWQLSTSNNRPLVYLPIQQHMIIRSSQLR